MYILASLLILGLVLMGVMNVIDSVFDTIGASDIRKLPIIGPNLNIICAVLMVWLLDVSLVSHWAGEMRNQDWQPYVVDGVAIFAMIPVMDSIKTAITKGMRA